MAIAVISDTHFGLPESTLSDPSKVDLLIQEIWHLSGGCDELILLGDIFDFWRARPERAVREARYFLKRIAEMGIGVRYVVGNHDHHLVVLKQEDDFMERAARGDLYPVYIPALCWSQTIDGLEMEMFYPTYQTTISNRAFLFTHGHHLDGVQVLSVRLMEKIRRLSGEELLPADLEMMMTYAYENIYRSAYIGEMVDLEDHLWRISSLLSWFKAGFLMSYRFTPVERQYGSILRFLSDRGLGWVDCFIYGDTHRAGIHQERGGPLAVNAGGLTAGSSSQGFPDTYLIIDEAGLAVRRMGSERPLLLCELL